MMLNESTPESQSTVTATSRGAKSPVTVALTRWFHGGLNLNKQHSLQRSAKGFRVRHSGVCLPASSQPTAGWQAASSPAVSTAAILRRASSSLYCGL